LKFFTRRWAHGDMIDEAADAVAPAYKRHLETLDLPQSMRELARLNPHDGYILDVGFEPLTSAMHLRLRCGDQQTGYFDASLSFSGVTIQPAHLTKLATAIRPAEFEILYDEVDRAGADVFDYRLLLRPDGDIEFQFKAVSVVRQRVADRHAR
jgi:hypothetical protein